MIQNTHLKIDKELCGIPVRLSNNYCKLKLNTKENMVVDDSRLIHGGFIFGFADFCAMLTINHQNVVLGSANCRFIKPVIAGELLHAEGTLLKVEGKKKIVKVLVSREDETVFMGEFVCFTPEKHILKDKGKK